MLQNVQIGLVPGLQQVENAVFGWASEFKQDFMKMAAERKWSNAVTS